MKNADNISNMHNANKGTSGYNAQYLARIKNTGDQKNPNNVLYKGGKK